MSYWQSFLHPDHGHCCCWWGDHVIKGDCRGEWGWPPVHRPQAGLPPCGGGHQGCDHPQLRPGGPGWVRRGEHRESLFLWCTLYTIEIQNENDEISFNGVWCTPWKFNRIWWCRVDITRTSNSASVVQMQSSQSKPRKTIIYFRGWWHFLFPWCRFS